MGGLDLYWILIILSAALWVAIGSRLRLRV